MSCINHDDHLQSGRNELEASLDDANFINGGGSKFGDLIPNEKTTKPRQTPVYGDMNKRQTPVYGDISIYRKCMPSPAHDANCRRHTLFQY